MTWISWQRCCSEVLRYEQQIGLRKNHVAIPDFLNIHSVFIVAIALPFFCGILTSTYKTYFVLHCSAHPSSLPRGALSRQLTSLLRCPRSNCIHQRRAQRIIRLQPLTLERLPDLVHPLRIKPLLNNAAHKRSKLRLLPALLVAQLDVDEIEALEGMVALDAAKQVHAAVFARVALNGGGLVDNGELGLAGRHG